METTGAAVYAGRARKIRQHSKFRAFGSGDGFIAVIPVRAAAAQTGIQFLAPSTWRGWLLLGLSKGWPTGLGFKVGRGEIRANSRSLSTGAKRGRAVFAPMRKSCP